MEKKTAELLEQVVRFYYPKAYIEMSKIELVRAENKARERLRKLKTLLAQRRFIINYDFTMDDEWTEDDYFKALNAIERWEKEYKWFDLTKIHLDFY